MSASPNPSIAGTQTSPNPTSPGLSTTPSFPTQTKPNRLVFKHTLSTATTPQPDDRRSWGGSSTPSYDSHAYRQEITPIEHTAPPVKRRKELESDEYGGDAPNQSSTVRKKNWVPLRKMLNNALKKLIDLDGYKFFYEPVSEKEAPGYFAIIKRPMDFSTMRRKMLEDKYPYWNLFVEDFELICQNCIAYNLPNSIYWNEAKTLLLEGKKYLKVQATKINPELLQPPENYNSSVNASSKADGSSSHANSVLEKPKRLYIRNEDLPRELVSAPPPVHLAKDSGYSGPLYITQESTVAKGTPQQQHIAEASEWTGFTVTSKFPSTHWNRSIPSYISYTRGSTDTATPRDRKIRASNRDPYSEAPTSKYKLPAHESYIKSMSKYASPRMDSSFIHTMSKSDKDRFNDLVSLLLPSATSDLPASFSSTSAVLQLNGVDTSPVTENTGDLLQFSSETSAEICDLLSTLSGSQIDLSFLENIFSTEENTSIPSAATSALLERNSEIAQLLHVSALQRRPTDSSLSSHDTNLLLELSANLIDVSSNLSPNWFAMSADAASRLREAIDAGVSTIPGSSASSTHM